MRPKAFTESMDDSGMSLPVKMALDTTTSSLKESSPDSVIAAYVNGWIDPLNRIGALGPVGARPAYRRQGLARAALLECLRRMQARGVDRVCVSTGASNTPALRLYQSIGFMVAGRQLEYVKPATRERPPDNAR